MSNPVLIKAHSNVPEEAPLKTENIASGILLDILISEH